MKPSKIALAHHWLVQMRGGEKVLESLCLLFPGAPIYTLVCGSADLGETIRRHPIVTSPIGRIPGAAKYYKGLLPLFPLAIRQLRVNTETELIFSSDASVIKGLAHRETTPHVCYCHSPARYLWDLHQTYMENTSGLGAAGRLAFRATTPYVRDFDYQAAQRVTHFIANSHFVRRRIENNYRRDAAVIHPPVDVARFDPTRQREEFYLIVAELVPYKRIDLAVEAFNKMGRRLIIIGDGSEGPRLRAQAKKNVTFLGRQTFAVLRNHFERCRAFIHPQIEDFGITAVEAQAAGSPVIAYRDGGALESIIENQTGTFFDEQSVECLADTIFDFEKREFSPIACRVNAEGFRPEVFHHKLRSFLAAKFPELFVEWQPESAAAC
jgi:glycosyltransferase involved in cell wall biosynthesis